MDLFLRSKASTRYLPESIQGSLLTSQSRGLLLYDESFIYCVNKEAQAGVFLPFEKAVPEGSNEAGYVQATILGDYIDAPLVAHHIFEKKIFEAIDEITQKNHAAKIMFLIDPLDALSHNYLQKYHYLDTSFLNYIIDLKTEKDFLARCSKGHRSDIRRMLSNSDFSVFYMDKENASHDIHEEYRLLHHKCSGRVTRPKETFDLQFEKLKKGYGALFGLKFRTKTIAFSCYEFHGKRAAYTSAADDPEYDHLPLYHVLMYSAVKYLKSKGVERIDSEPPSGPSVQMGYIPTVKQTKIALFKRGFSGYYVQNFCGVKYFSKEVFQNDLKDFMKLYIQSEVTPLRQKSV